MDPILLAVVILAVVALVYGLCLPTKKPEAQKPTLVSMPTPDTFETLSYKNYSRARELETKAKIPSPKSAAHKSSIEHLDFVSNRYAQLLADEEVK